MLILIVIVVVVALIYDMFNGMNDCANAIATTVSTRALPPWAAVAQERAIISRRKRFIIFYLFKRNN